MITIPNDEVVMRVREVEVPTKGRCTFFTRKPKDAPLQFHDFSSQAKLQLG